MVVRLIKQGRGLIYFFTMAFLAALIVLLSSVNPLRAETEAQLGTINGVVWFDQNRNGIFDADEPVMTNHPVYLQGIGEDQPGALVARVMTDDAGNFTFTNIQCGDYRLYVENGDSMEITVSHERNSGAVKISFAGQQIFLPMIGR